jgi:predicted outer membrane repeat protein
VNSTGDIDQGNALAHTGDLRFCLTHAATGDAIGFDSTVFTNAGATIQLKLGEIAFSTSLTIKNLTGNSITIDAQNNSRIFDITNAGEIIDNLNFINGSAPGKTEPHSGLGGAIYIQGSLTLDSDTFSNDSASLNGGAIYNSAPSGATGILEVNGPNSMFRNDLAGGSGGAIAVNGNNINLSNVGFTSDSATVSGGAVQATVLSALGTGASMQVTSCAFTSNQATGPYGYGGAIYTSDNLTISCPVTAAQTTFNTNSATRGGGAIFFKPPSNLATNMQLTNVAFSNNTSGLGGAVASSIISGTGADSVTIQGCLFNGNQANATGGIDNGGGLYYSGTTTGSGSASLAITNSTFYKNSGWCRRRAS